MIRIENLSKIFKTSTEVHALRGVSANVEKGDIFGVIGMTAIQGIATINEAGVAQWIGTEGVIVTSLSGGRLAVSLPSISNDTITVISGNKFTL